MTPSEEQYIKNHPTPYPKMHYVNSATEERKLYDELNAEFGLSRDERRALVLAMGINSLLDMIVVTKDEQLVSEMEATIEASKAEYDHLFESGSVNHAALVMKLLP